MKAILFHHAGGDKYAYREFQKHLLPLESVSIELPGRGDRYSEKLVHTIDEMLDDLLEQTMPYLQEEYFFVGMSMGAVLSFLLTHKLKSLNLPLPKHLFMASRLPFRHYETTEDIESFSGDKLWNFISEYDERSKGIIANKELREFFEPLVKADFVAMQHFDKRFQDLPKLDIPASIFYGKTDHKMYDEEKAKKWNDYFIEEPEYKGFDGGHFFIYENPTVPKYIFSKIA